MPASVRHFHWDTMTVCIEKIVKNDLGIIIKYSSFATYLIGIICDEFDEIPWFNPCHAE